MTDFVSVLPENYREIYHIDAREKKTGLIFTLFSFVITAAVLIPFLCLTNFAGIKKDQIVAYYFVFLGGMVAYIVLHELTHGAAYKAMTKQKLTFGISWSAAFCGVPDIYVSRRTALIALAMPLAVFTALLLPLAVILYPVDAGWFLVVGVIFAIHLGGCIGDMYMLWLLLTRYKNSALLMRDTGPEQFLYMPEN